MWIVDHIRDAFQLREAIQLHGNAFLCRKHADRAGIDDDLRAAVIAVRFFVGQCFRRRIAFDLDDRRRA